MKILIAPANYMINDIDGSESTRAYEYIKEIASDKSVSGDVLVAYCDDEKMGNFQVHSMLRVKPSFINILLRLKFIWWVYRKGKVLLGKNHYDSVWHLGPFAIGETFSLLGLSLPRSQQFVIGPIYTPFRNRKKEKHDYVEFNKNKKISLSLRNHLDLKVYSLFARFCLPLSTLTLRKATSVIAIENEGLRILNSMQISHSQVIPLTIDALAFKVSKRHKLGDKLRLLSVGYLVDRKRMSDIVDAVYKLVNDHHITNLELTIVGSGPKEQELKEQIKKHNLGKYIKLIGFVPRIKVAEYFKSSDIFISASVAESMPGVYFEAMTSGLPMILVENFSSLSLAANNFGGILVPAYSSGAIANAVVDLANNPHKYQEYSTINVKLMETVYNFKENITKLKKLLGKT